MTDDPGKPPEPKGSEGGEEASGRGGEEAEETVNGLEEETGAEGADPGDEEGEADRERRRPISVRDLMPSPPTRPTRRGSEEVERAARAGEREERGERGAEEKVAGEARTAEEGGEEPAAPTPVRVAMDAAPPGDSRPVEELPSRRFEVRGEEWIARITGRTVTGTRPDAGALLMELTFSRPDDPQNPFRKLLTVDRPLDALYDEDLIEMFERSRSVGREEGAASGPQI